MLHLIERMVVEDEGEGDAVVCVHGLGGSASTFTPLMPALARHRVLRVELPGSARSQRAEGPLSIARFVEAVQAACAKAGVTRAHLVGHSLGTIVCQHLAVEAPKLVRSLALFGPLAAPPVAPPQAVRSLAERLHAAPSARVVVLPRCGHWTPIERPEECARELREFLGAQR